MDGSKINTWGPKSGVAPFAGGVDGGVGRAVVSDSRACASRCAFSDKDDKEQNSRLEDKNRSNLSFIRTPAYNGYDTFRKDKRLP